MIDRFKCVTPHVIFYDQVLAGGVGGIILGRGGQIARIGLRVDSPVATPLTG